MKKIFTLAAMAALTLGAMAQTGDPIYVATIHNNANYLLKGTFDATFEEYEDAVIIKSFDGTEGNDLLLEWDDAGWCAINGEENPWMYITDATYYGVYLYTGNYIGGTWDEEGGFFWIGAYAYADESSTGDWGYLYWDWTAADIAGNEPDGITTARTSAPSSTLFDLNGRKFRSMPTKAIIIKNGKKSLN